MRPAAAADEATVCGFENSVPREDLPPLVCGCERSVPREDLIPLVPPLWFAEKVDSMLGPSPGKRLGIECELPRKLPRGCRSALGPSPMENFLLTFLLKLFARLLTPPPLPLLLTFEKAKDDWEAAAENPP
jgi:hypothetical protein